MVFLIKSIIISIRPNKEIIFILNHQQRKISNNKHIKCHLLLPILWSNVWSRLRFSNCQQSQHFQRQFCSISHYLRQWKILSQPRLIQSIQWSNQWFLFSGQGMGSTLSTIDLKHSLQLNCLYQLNQMQFYREDERQLINAAQQNKWDSVLSQIRLSIKPSLILQISFSNYDIKIIPTYIRCLVNLRSLCLDRNKIAKIQNLQNFQQLTELNFDFNQIKKVQNISKLKALTSLQLGYNKINNLRIINNPSSFNFLSLKQLFFLNVYDNEITSAQGILYIQMPNLNELRFTWNKLGNLRVFRRMNTPNIERLNICQNLISEFQCFSEFQCGKLKYFWFDQQKMKYKYKFTLKMQSKQQQFEQRRMLAVNKAMKIDL